ncbi:uncharacterized protein [Coffea arabica]|uniref:DUF7086 domain-containing protein n=1 Tax=Coffea arabica TaxID=13443 RepID=A0ABM4WNI8_COFAR
MNNQKDISNDNQEINRKRKTNDNNNHHEFQIPRKFSSSDHLVEDDDNDLLTLSLSFRPAAIRPRKHSPIHQQPPLPPPPSMQQHQPFIPQPPPPPSYPLYMPPVPMRQQTQSPHLLPDTSSLPTLRAVVHRQEPSSASAGQSRPARPRRNPSQAPHEGKSETVPAPFPWATTRRASVYSLNYLLSKQIFKISGEVQCKRCEKRYEMEYDLREKFIEVGSFIAENKSGMHDRAPGVWMNPVLPACKLCEQDNCVKPIIPEKKKAINWLFLLLGQMLGCCTLEQLKYFCKHTKNHRTGAKDRVLYLTYLGLCKQLDPNGPFDR